VSTAVERIYFIIWGAPFIAQNNMENDEGLKEDISGQDVEVDEQSSSDEDFYARKLQEENAKLLEERENYKQGMLAAKKKLKDVQTVDVEAIKESLQREMDEKLEGFKKEMVGDIEADVISSNSSSEAEAKLIKFHLDNTFKRTGFDKTSIASDVAKAKQLINAERVAVESSEIKEAMKSRATTETNPGGSGVKLQSDTKKYSEAEKKFLANYGVKI